MFNDKNAILAKNLHVNSFKYQSTEDIPNEAYENGKKAI